MTTPTAYTSPYLAEELLSEEFPQLLPLPVSETLKQLDPASSAVCVVRDAIGRIVAAVGVLTVTHTDEWWIEEAHRHNPSVVQALLTGTFQMLRDHGLAMTCVLAPTPEIGELIEKLGGVDVGRLYLLRVPEE